MNALYTLALRQSSALQSELSLLEASFVGSPASNGSSQPGPSSYNRYPYDNGGGAQANGGIGLDEEAKAKIQNELDGLKRTIDDYEKMANREMVESKKERAMTRVKKFKDDYAAHNEQYKRLKQFESDRKAATTRAELFSGASPSSTNLGPPPSQSSSTNFRYGVRPLNQPSESPYGSLHSRGYSAASSSTPGSTTPNGFGPTGGGGGSNPYSYPPGDFSGPRGGAGGSLYGRRTDAALGENTFIKTTNDTLDMYLAQGKAVLDNLTNQRDVMKGTQRRLLSAANTLGLSRETISFIERRSKADLVILAVGATFTIGCFIAILRYLG